MQGDHSQVPGELKPSPEPKLVFPMEAPGFALNQADGFAVQHGVLP